MKIFFSVVLLLMPFSVAERRQMSVSGSSKLSDVLSESETTDLSTYHDVKVENNKDSDNSSDNNKIFCMDVTTANLHNNSVHSNSPNNNGNFIYDYNPFKCLNAMAEQSLAGSFTLSSYNNYGDVPHNDEHKHITDSCNSGTSATCSIISCCHDFMSCDQHINNQSSFGNMYSSLLSTSSLPSSSSSLMPTSSHCINNSAPNIRTFNDFLSNSSFCCHNTSSPANENRSSGFTGNDISLSQTLRANHCAVDDKVNRSPSACNKHFLSCSSKDSCEENDSLRWSVRHPESWSNRDVLDWVFFVAQERGIDMQEFRAENFQGHTGIQLCQMSLENFVSLEPRFGKIIYEMFRKLVCAGMTTNTFLRQEKSSNMDSSDIDITSYDFDLDDSPCIMTSQELCHTKYSPNPGNCAQTPSTRPACCLPAMTFSAQVPKRRPGRPRATIHVNNRVNKDKKVKNKHLWEFIYETLTNPMYNPQYLKWENQRDGVFRFVQSEAVAQLWGDRKHNEHMTYEKLSRAMRHYYRRGILERVEGRRLVYKFSLKAMERVQEQKR